MYRIVRYAYEDKQNERGHICSYYLINYIDWIQINVLYKFTRIRFVYTVKMIVISMLCKWLFLFSVTRLSISLRIRFENFHFSSIVCVARCQTSLAYAGHLGECAWYPGISCFHSCITRWKAVINFKSLCCSTGHFCLQTRLIRQQQQLSVEMVSYRSGLNESMSCQRDREMWHLL